MKIRRLAHRPAWRAAAASRTTLAAAGLRGASGVHTPRGLTILKGAVPDRARGPGHMAPTYFCRFPGSQLRRPSRLRTLSLASSCTGASDKSDGRAAFRSTRSRRPCAAPRSRGATRCRAAERAGRRARRSPRAPFPLPVAPGVDRLRLLAAQERDQSVPLMRKLADAGRAARAAGRGRPRQAADHARLGVRRSRSTPASGASASRRPTRPRSLPTSCSCRCWPSTAPATASAMAPATTT